MAGHHIAALYPVVAGCVYEIFKERGRSQGQCAADLLKVIQELHKYRVEYFKSWLYMVAKPLPDENTGAAG